jgi:hypothetical protein
MHRPLAFTTIAALAVLLFSADASVAADSRAISAVANPNAAELKCPATPKAATPAPQPTVPEEDPEVVPSEEDLGDLAHPAPVPKPTVDASLVSGFSLRAADGRLRPMRIGIWGDSHMASGVFSGELTRAITTSGTQVDSEYLPPTMGRSGVRLPIRKYCQATTWKLEPAYTSAARVVQTGLGLVNLRSTRKGAYLWLDFRRDAPQPSRVVRLRVMYLPGTAVSTLGLTVDGGIEQKVTLARVPAGATDVRTADINVSTDGRTPLSTLKLRVIEGSFVLQGFLLSNREPRPVTMDVFGLPSATMRGWSQIDTAYMKDALRGASYDAVILEYGTNEGNARNFERDKYASALSGALEGFRAVFPEAACLLIGPTDRGVKIRKPSASKSRRRPTTPPEPPDLLKFARVHREITEVQAEVGKRYNCASWDWQAFMGGPASMYSWVLSTPPLAARDLTHLTPTGYRQSAGAVARALGWEAERADAPVQGADARPVQSP